MTGSLWESENGDDAFDELNRITAGSNGGWVQVMGPVDGVAEFKEIESTFTPIQGNLPVAERAVQPDRPGHVHPGAAAGPLRRRRTSPTPRRRRCRGCSCSPARTTRTPSSVGSGPSPRRASASSAAGSARSTPATCSSASRRTFLDNGYLFDFKFDQAREQFAFTDPALADKVDDNDYKFDEGESESLVVGKNFGIVTDIETGPDGNLYVTSLSNGAVYMITQEGDDAHTHPDADAHPDARRRLPRP